MRSRARWNTGTRADLAAELAALPGRSREALQARWKEHYGEHVYASNIQIAELNALNAVLAVLKWKKLCGFYRDLEREHHSVFATDCNQLLGGDSPCES